MYIREMENRMNKKGKTFALAAAGITAAVAVLMGACAGSPGGSSKTQPDIAITENASVHDPSVFYDEASGTYYAFGSHFAVASSTDLVNWRQVAQDGASGQELLYGTTNWRGVLSQSDALVGGTQNTWAPDVEYYGGKYYMYYSLTAGFGSSNSVIGRVESESVLGPYSNEKIIVTGVGSSMVNKPNCIDPELFYDKDGGLWMVYGSFFGGIYILELYNEGENWGLPKPDQGEFGTLLWANPNEGAEGPFVFYNAETDYYYLLVSYGSLSTNYNLRVARSRNPNGPYEDITGTDVSVNGRNAYKLAGNYRVGDAEGVAAIGHGSVAEKDGEFIFVGHSRRDDGRGGVTGGHSMWAAKLLFNEDGWPVMTPCRYTGEEARSFTASDIAGSYDLLFFYNTSSATFEQSAEYTFRSDGKIMQNDREVGAFALSGDNRITITINNTEYKGAVADCWNTYTDQGGAICLSAVSASSSVTLWAVGK